MVRLLLALLSMLLLGGVAHARPDDPDVDYKLPIISPNCAAGQVGVVSILCTIPGAPTVFSVSSNLYYVSNTGSDNNNGTSPSTPWQTITKVNCGPSTGCTIPYPAGSTVLFNGGQNFTGCLAFKGYDGGSFGPTIGNADKGSLTVSSYGGTTAQITSNCLGANTPAVLLDGVNNFTWVNLNVLGGSISDPIGTYTFFYSNTPTGSGVGPVGSPFTTGIIFTPNVAGNISGGRYYKPANEPSTSRNIILWSCATSACSSGTNINQCTTSGEPTSGPISNVTCNFPSASTITPGNNYIISADLPTGGSQLECGNGATCPQNSNLPMSRVGPVYAAGASTFPSTSAGSTFYPVDPIFNTTAAYSSPLTYDGFIIVNNCGSSCTSSGITIESSAVQNFGGHVANNPAEIQIIGDNFNGQPGPIDSINILNNTLGGINGPTSPDNFGINGYGYAVNVTNVLYQGNTITNLGGDAGGAAVAIVADGVNGGVIQYNLMHDIGTNSTGSCGPGGLETYTAKNIVLKYNEVYNLVSTADPTGGCDWDAMDGDGGTQNTTFEYNYLHNIQGPCQLFYAVYAGGVDWGNNISRFNVCENTDIGAGGGAFEFGGGSFPALPAHFYGNTSYQVMQTNNPGACFYAFAFNLFPYGSEIRNNICYISNGTSNRSTFISFLSLYADQNAGNYQIFPSAATGTGIAATSAMTQGAYVSIFAPGTITGVNMYKPANNTATSHTFRLWDATAQTQLASCSTSGETTGSIVQVGCSFPTAYTLTPNYYYIVTVDIANGETYFECGTGGDACSGIVTPITVWAWVNAASADTYPATKLTSGLNYTVSPTVTTTDLAGIHFGNNDYYSTAGTPQWVIQSNTYTTLSTWQAGVNSDSTSGQTNPQLTNVANGGTCTWTPSTGVGPQPCPSAYTLVAASGSAAQTQGIGADLLSCPPGGSTSTLGPTDYYGNSIASLCAVSTAPPTGVATWGGSGTTYYISAAGSDTNNGTSKSTPWAHAPGMPNCTSTCASVTPAAGMNFVFRGGDSWHLGNSSASPYVGGTWTIPATVGGTSAGCNFESYASPLHSTCAYYGIDPTWYSGASWARPIFNLDNPTSTSSVASCSYEQHNFIGISIGSYVALDNFEYTGLCVSQPTSFGAATYSKETGNYIAQLNVYAHGWTENTSGGAGTDEPAVVFGTHGAGPSFNVHRYMVVDGSDTFCTGNDACEMFSFQAEGYDLDHSYVARVSNGIASNTSIFTIHDNLFENIYESWDGFVHGNVAESNAIFTSNIPSYLYNNIMRNTNIGVGFWLEPYAQAYWFNNVIYGNANPGNAGVTDSEVGQSNVDTKIFNNTVDSPDTWIRLSSHGNYPGTVEYQNNHFIGYSPAALSSVWSGTPTLTPTDSGGELFQSESTANGQGFTTSNNYAPTSLTNSTIHAGTDMTSICNGMADATAAAACLKGTTVVSYNSTNHTVILNDGAAARSSGHWDAGAYQYQAGD